MKTAKIALLFFIVGMPQSVVAKEEPLSWDNLSHEEEPAEVGLAFDIGNDIADTKVELFDPISIGNSLSVQWNPTMIDTTFGLQQRKRPCCFSRTPE